jgi:hypothetical protein
LHWGKRWTNNRFGKKASRTGRSATRCCSRTSTSGCPISNAAFQAGGVTLPWGIAVDGNDNVWVANFAGQRLMQLCGVADAQHCPPGVRTGDALSPDAGYFSDALVRVTGVQIDASGNVWAANNWLIEGFTSKNPGGHEVVVFVGLAAPVKPPLIGPPRRP